jgi:hypothetical protein
VGGRAATDIVQGLAYTVSPLYCDTVKYAQHLKRSDVDHINVLILAESVLDKSRDAGR